MHIGIILYSLSGNTATVAKAIVDRFRKHGHEVDVKLLIANNMRHLGSKRFTLGNTPDQEEIDEYEAIIFGAPVWFFKASPVMLKFQAELTRLKGKRVVNFVTQLSPWPELGGHQALTQMKKQLDGSGATVLTGGAVPCFFGPDKNKLADLLEKIYHEVTAAK